MVLQLLPVNLIAGLWRNIECRCTLWTQKERFLIFYG
uniref:Uncharacterized protein n=1 Tax=Anguilla anguilla TaxID=7936 RepID=A0A0E9VUW8_ANGAN